MITAGEWAGLAVGCGASVAISSIGTPILRRRLMRSNTLDVPNERSSHTSPTPRGAGLVVGAASLVGLALTLPGWRSIVVAVAAASLGAVGWIDDRRDLPVRLRLGAQFLVAAILAGAILFPGESIDVGRLAAWAVAVTGVVGFVNAFNFMDGINGISAGQSIVAGVFFTAVGVIRDLPDVAALGVVLAGSMAAFLPFNAPTASIFLGDVGSYFFGCWLGATALVAASHGVPLEVVVAPGLLYVIDTGSTLAIRYHRGNRLGEAHRDHAYQILARRAGQHAPAALAATALIGVASLAAILTLDSTLPVRLATVAATGLATLAAVVAVRLTSESAA